MAKKILLADDSMTIQKVVELTFMDQDYEVTAVSDGTAAVAKLDESQPDIVIADVHMPGADGYAVCRHSKGKSPETPVLLLVGTFEQFDEGQAAQVGADDHLKKPFDSQELLQKVEAMVSGGGSAPPAPSADSAPELSTQPAQSPQQRGPVPAAPEPAPPTPPGPEAAAPSSPAAAAAPAGKPDYTSPDPAPPQSATPPAAPEPAAPEPATPGPAAPGPATPEPAAPAPPSRDFTSPEPAPPASAASEAPAPQPPQTPQTPQPAETVAVPQPEAAAAAPTPEFQPSAAETRPRRAEAPPEAESSADEPESAEESPAASESSAEAAASETSEGAAGANGDGGLSDEDVERIARKVLELSGGSAVKEVAWEVIPDLAEVVIRERIQELEAEVD